MLRPHLRAAMDLALVGSVGLALAGAFLLIVLIHRVCLLGRGLGIPALAQQAHQRL